MLRRWKKALLLSIAVCVRSMVVPMARFSDRMRAKADALLPALALLALVGSLLACSYVTSTATAVQVMP
jgi:hypothetical protein